jgi:hypothetical protein
MDELLCLTETIYYYGGRVAVAREINDIVIGKPGNL